MLKYSIKDIWNDVRQITIYRKITIQLVWGSLMFTPIKVEVVNHFFHELRTNNHVQAWHLGMKNIKLENLARIFFEIIYVMQKKQAITNMKLNQFFGCILSKILYKHVITSFLRVAFKFIYSF